MWQTSLKVKSDISQGGVFITSGKVFETFLDIHKDFTMAKDTYRIIVNNAM